MVDHGLETLNYNLKPFFSFMVNDFRAVCIVCKDFVNESTSLSWLIVITLCLV